MESVYIAIKTDSKREKAEKVDNVLWDTMELSEINVKPVNFFEAKSPSFLTFLFKSQSWQTPLLSFYADELSARNIHNLRLIKELNFSWVLEAQMLTNGELLWSLFSNDFVKTGASSMFRKNGRVDTLKKLQNDFDLMALALKKN